MKLYNLYQEVILEESQKQLKLLSEGISDDGIKAAIQGKYNVRIYYRDHDDGTPPSRRYVQIYTLGISKAGNQMIRAFQINGFTNHPEAKKAWKTFRVDRIESLEPTKFPWYNPMSDYRAGVGTYVDSGDKEFSSITMQVDPDTFNRERMLRNIAAKQNKEKQMPEPQPIYNQPAPEPKPAPAKPRPVPRRPAQPKPIEPRPTQAAPAQARPNVNRQQPTEPEVGNKEEL